MILEHGGDALDFGRMGINARLLGADLSGIPLRVVAGPA